MTIRIGGFESTSEPFLSRGLRPYERSFALSGQAAVGIGWPSMPVGNVEQYPTTLDDIRRSAARFGIFHRHYSDRWTTDNDFYFRLGSLQDNASEASKRSLEVVVRDQLANNPPTYVRIGLEDVSVVAFENEELPLDSSTQAMTVSEAVQRLQPPPVQA